VRNEFCTILDLNYLPRGLVLYHSLADVCGGFRLRVFCMDEETRSILERMRLANLVTTGIDELESYDPDLRAVKGTRNSVEYCWTAKPSICLYSLAHGRHLEMVTYLDADTMFFDDPAPVFAEMGDASVLLTPARDPEGDGRVSYTTPLLPLRADTRTETALRWWRERCLEWCYDRVEEGRWSDLTYLNEWPQRFPGVRVLEHPGCLGEWNIRYFRVSAADGRVLVDDRPLVLFHYGALWIYSGRLTRLPRLGFLAGYYRVKPGPLVWATANPIAPDERRLLWEPYLRRLGTAIDEVRAVEPSFHAGLVHLTVRELAYSTVRWALPASVRRPLKESLSRRRSVRGLGPPGSPR
jgi:hypothetical protein